MYKLHIQIKALGFQKISGQQTIYNSGNTNGEVAENGKMLNHE